MMNRLTRKFETALEYLPKAEVKHCEGARIGMIAYGSTDPAVLEAQDHMQAAGMPVDYLRLLSTPFGPEVEEFIRTHERVYVAELNRDGQMRQMLMMELPELANKTRSVCHLDGLPMTAHYIESSIKAQEGQ